MASVAGFLFACARGQRKQMRGFLLVAIAPDGWNPAPQWLRFERVGTGTPATGMVTLSRFPRTLHAPTLVAAGRGGSTLTAAALLFLWGLVLAPLWRSGRAMCNTDILPY